MTIASAQVRWHRVKGGASASHPVSLAEVRARLRLDATVGDDDDVTLMLADAEKWWEDYTGCSLMPRTIDLVVDRFPTHAVLPLQTEPIRSIDVVTYVDEAGVSQILAPAMYQADTGTRGGRLRIKGSWPSTEVDRINTVNVAMSAGYADAASVPGDIKSALILVVGARYNFREELIAGTIARSIPGGAQSIADRYKLVSFEVV